MNTEEIINNDLDGDLDDLHSEAAGKQEKVSAEKPGNTLQDVLNEVENLDLSEGKKRLADWAYMTHNVKLQRNKTIENMLKDFQKAMAPKSGEEEKSQEKQQVTALTADGIDRDSHWADWDLDELDNVDLGRTSRIDFSHITEDPANARFAFAIVHRYPSGNIQKHEKRGWRKWQEVGDDDRFVEPGASEASRHDKNFASVPVGAHEEGIQIAYLMYMPKAIYEKTILAAHKKKADDQLSIVVDPKFEDPELVDPSKAATTSIRSNVQNVDKPNEA